jgi:hypothetical protein
MVAKKRGGFFGSLWKGIQNFAKPFMGSIGKVVQGITGGAKKQATRMAHQAITNVADGSHRAMQSGDWKGEAGRAYNNTRREAVGRAQQHYSQGRTQMRQAVSHQIRDYQRRFDDRMERQYSQWRRHPRFEQPRYRQQYGPPPPRQWRGYYGAGFGKAHFKKIEKAAHKHIDKVFAAAHKHTKAQINALKTGTKKGAAKKAAASAIHAAHKEHGGNLTNVIKAVKLDIVKKSKKGGGRAVGAGRKVGAGAKKKLVPVVVEEAPKKGKKSKQLTAALKEVARRRAKRDAFLEDAIPLIKKGSGRAVGAGRKRKKNKKRGGMHTMNLTERQKLLGAKY